MAIAGAALLAATGVPLSAAQAGPAAPASDHSRRSSAPDGVTVNMFEWNWPSIAKECTDVLGPAGYAGVQVAPPQDSVKRLALGNGSDTVLHPWWEVYQPVSYALRSRMGTEEQFTSMVTTCRKAGVKVYVDAVINHMTGQGSVSYGGVSYTHFDYPGLYGPANFHQKGAECTSSNGGIEDFNNVSQVRNCELVGLSDLKTESSQVRDQLATYLNKLIGYGVSGFRVDAAKHIGQPDLAAIISRLDRTADGAEPYIALEVFEGGPGILSPFAFTETGDVLGLDGDKQIKNAFKSYPAAHIGSIAALKVFGQGSGLVPSENVLSFVANHDTERDRERALNYQDGATNTIAHEFLLAYGYGKPQVYSSFAWKTRDDGPPSDADGFVTDAKCDGTWTCVHRDKGILGMVRWHNVVGDTRLRNWADDGGNLISFSRGHRGWIAINNDPGAHDTTVQTGLPAGTYCDVIHGTVSGGTCSGPTVTVDAQGRTSVKVGGKDAVAFTIKDRVS